jgi:hypothetical protein
MRYLLAVLLTGCTGIVMQPTESSPAPVCRISCSSGRWLSRPQHICVGSTFFEDATATGRIVRATSTAPWTPMCTQRGRVTSQQRTRCAERVSR